MSFLEVEGITKKFGGLTAVNKVSFRVEKGEIVSIIGPNGAVKTILKTIPGNKPKFILINIKQICAPKAYTEP